VNNIVRGSLEDMARAYVAEYTSKGAGSKGDPGKLGEGHEGHQYTSMSYIHHADEISEDSIPSSTSTIDYRYKSLPESALPIRIMRVTNPYESQANPSHLAIQGSPVLVHAGYTFVPTY
jgi:hypothetical protein